MWFESWVKEERESYVIVWEKIILVRGNVGLRYRDGKSSVCLKKR